MTHDAKAMLSDAMQEISSGLTFRPSGPPIHDEALEAQLRDIDRALAEAAIAAHDYVVYR